MHSSGSLDENRPPSQAWRHDCQGPRFLPVDVDLLADGNGGSGVVVAPAAAVIVVAGGVDDGDEADDDGEADIGEAVAAVEGVVEGGVAGTAKYMWMVHEEMNEERTRRADDGTEADRVGHEDTYMDFQGLHRGKFQPYLDSCGNFDKVGRDHI
ncbi:hypothetical protein BGX27_002557 [Mortierella sp. AM989]|nr:hypothetical protein BGX27_002557 [Mortierella sp. AM989]